MADELSSLSNISTQQVTGIFAKREGRKDKQQQFGSHLGEGDAERAETESDPDGRNGDADAPVGRAPHPRRGKVIDYEA